jgi:intracellular septation protein A
MNCKISMEMNTTISIWKKISVLCILACTVLNSYAQKEACNRMMWVKFKDSGKQPIKFLNS